MVNDSASEIWSSQREIVGTIDHHGNVWNQHRDMIGSMDEGGAVWTNEHRDAGGSERENRELQRANEILKSAAAFFGAGLDRRQKR